MTKTLPFNVELIDLISLYPDLVPSSYALPPFPQTVVNHLFGPLNCHV